MKPVANMMPCRADAQVPVTHIRDLDEVVAGSVSVPRALAILLPALGRLAVGIRAVGVYILIFHLVCWCNPGISLLPALGVQQRQNESAVLRQSLWLAGGGCFAGLPGMLAVNQLLQSLLFEVSAPDRMTVCVTLVSMGIFGIAAAWILARRAAGLGNTVILRGE